jgi:hypothetical protein
VRSAEEIAIEKIGEDLGEIKGHCQNLYLGMEFIKREIDSLRAEKRVSAERVSDKLDKMLVSMSNLSYVMKELTAPGVLAGYKVRHPELIDTAPQEIYDDLAKAAQEIEGDVNSRCDAFAKKMLELTSNRDSTQYLADCVALLKEMHREIESRRDRVEALKKRRRNSDKNSNEQRNAAILMVKVKSMIEPLEKFTEFVLDSYFAKRHRIMSEIWRTTAAIEELYDSKSVEYKEKVPAASDAHKIGSALKELTQITTRHSETHKANMMVKTGNMSVLERRRMLAGLKPTTKI